VGGGPAGYSAALAYRDAGGSADVVILGAEDHLPYNRPPLTKEYLRGEHGRGELFLEAPALFGARGIEVRTSCVVARIDPEAGTVVTEDGEELAFGGCLLATGAEPTRLAVPGGDGEHLLSMRAMEDSERLQAQAAPGVTVTVVGSGFIGCEAAASLAMRGCEVMLVSDEKTPQAARLGEEVGALLAGWLEEAGVSTLLGAGVESFGPEGRSLRVGGEEISSEVILVATGVKPRIDLAQQAELEIEEGRVRTDSSLRTSAGRVLAAGDIAYALNPAAGRRLAVEHWGEALAQGEVAGKVLAGQKARWEQAPGFWSSIGARTLKYVAWGDGHDEVRLDRAEDGSFTAWYAKDGTVVGVLAHERDGDYERGRELVESGASLS
jgi:NADPH-dependent 2,4-dienoyl-CoA reductase/sulfur reductase-like enzyme